MAGEVWEPDALTAHVRIYEGPRVNEAKYRKIQAPSKCWMANRESTRYDKPKRPRSTHPELPIGRFGKSNFHGGGPVTAIRSNSLDSLLIRTATRSDAVQTVRV